MKNVEQHATNPHSNRAVWLSPPVRRTGLLCRPIREVLMHKLEAVVHEKKAVVHFDLRSGHTPVAKPVVEYFGKELYGDRLRVLKAPAKGAPRFSVALAEVARADAEIAAVRNEHVVAQAKAAEAKARVTSLA